MNQQAAARIWAEDVFGEAECGDRRRTDRVVSIAASAASAPAGTITAVLTESAARQGAFRWLENPLVHSAAISEAMFGSTVRACNGKKVFVAIDGSSLALTDLAGSRDVGGVGAWRQNGRGLQVASALAIASDGTPIGIAGQTYWARQKKTTKYQTDHSMETETRYGVDLLKDVHARFTEHNADVTPWFQLDRGYDVWPVLLEAVRNNMLITVRANHDRCVRKDRHEPTQYLKELAYSAPRLGYYELQIPGRPGRSARSAKMQVRARKVTIELHVTAKKCQYVTLTVVLVEECTKDNPLTWMLLTTAPVRSRKDALEVVRGYTMRWRIEEFHRAWKKGVCNVEDTQLRSRESIIKWATILAAVAARSIRLTYLAREQPDLPATEEFSRDELHAIIALRQPKGVKLSATPSLATAVGWIADLGGYTGKSSGGPPGPTVVTRGLGKVDALAKGLKNMRKM
jgi:hypothetical protein